MFGAADDDELFSFLRVCLSDMAAIRVVMNCGDFKN